MMKRFCACLLTALLMMSSAFAAVGVDAFVADKDENYIPIPAAYEVYTTFKNLDDYGFMNHPRTFSSARTTCSTSRTRRTTACW